MEENSMPFRVGHKIIAEHSFETRAEMNQAIDEAMRPHDIDEAEPNEPTPIILYLSDDLTVESLVELVNRYGGLANARIF